jgi:hypothetical protein
MAALVRAAPPALWHERGRRSVAARFPEFRAWHDLLDPLFGVEAPKWREETPPQAVLGLGFAGEDDEEEAEDLEEEDEGDEE